MLVLIQLGLILIAQVEVVARFIYSQDIEINYNNAGFASQFTLPFKLESPLQGSDYFKIVFPFPLHSTYDSTTLIADDLALSYSSQTSGHHCGNTAANQSVIQVNLLSSGLIEENSYYISFKDEYGSRVGLQANLFYNLVIELTGSNVDIQAPGTQNPVEMYTVSTISQNALIYDQNPVFGVFALSEYPLNQMDTYFNVISNEDFHKLDQIYTVQLVITVKQTILDSGRLVIRFTDNSFVFFSSCVSTEGSSVIQIAKLSENSYTCGIFGSELVVNVMQTINANTIYQFEFKVQNPRIVVGDVALEVLSLYSNMNRIIEQAFTPSGFYTQQVNLLSHTMMLAWGLDYSPSSMSFYPFNLQILRADSLAPVYLPYNGFQWTFQLQDDVPSGLQLHLEVKLPNKINTYVLPGSISHNFAPFASDPVNCYLINFNDPTNALIRCLNIGSLFKSQVYKIGCRITFPYDKFTSTLETNFGLLTIYSLDSNGQKTVNSLTQPSNPVSLIQSANNPNWFNANAAYGNTAVSSESQVSSAPPDPATTVLGIQPISQQLQRLVFNLNVPILHVFDATTPSSEAIPNNAGIVIVANPNSFTFSTNTDAEFSISKTTQTFAYEFKNFSSVIYHQLTLTAPDTGALYNTFCLPTGTTSSSNYFSVTNVYVNAHSSLYADDGLMDFYIGSFNAIKSSFPILKKLFLYNAYTINSNSPSAVRFGVSNFWTSIASENDGSKFPTVLRLAGYFSSNDINGAQNKISLFFRGLEPFYLNYDKELNPQVACFSTLANSIQCKFYPSYSYGTDQSFLNFNRLEIQFETIPSGSNQQFQLIIPMKTTKNYKVMNIFLGMLTSSNLYDVFSGLSSLTAVYRLTGGANIQANQVTGFAIDTVVLPSEYKPQTYTTLTYDLDITALTVGQKNIDLPFKVGHQDNSNNILPNSGLQDPLNGGAAFITSPWNFLTDQSTISFALAGNDATGSCISFAYPISVSASGVQNLQYTIYCPYERGTDTVTTTLVVQNGLVSYTNGNKLPPGTYFGWSANNGQLTTCKDITAAASSNTIPTTGVISIVSISPKLGIGFNQIALQWTFQTSNPISNDNILRITFAGSLQVTQSVQGSRCLLSSVTWGDFDHTCTIVFNTPTPYFEFAITNCISCPIASGKFILYQYGLNNPNTAGTNRAFSMQLYSANGKVIDQSSTNGLLEYDNAASLQQMNFQNLKLSYQNMRSRGSGQFEFYVSNRVISKTEKILLTLGGLGQDNSITVDNIQCQIQEYDSSGLQIPSYYWKTLDLTNLQSVELLPKIDILIKNKVFIFYCDGLMIPYSYNPGYITGYLGLQGDIIPIQAGSYVSIGTLKSASLFSKANLVIQSKKDNSIGSTLDFIFNITSKLMVMNTYCSVVINFPTVYSPKLTSSQLFCSFNEIFISCNANIDYTIRLQNLPIDQIPIGTSFVVRVFGVRQPKGVTSTSTIFVAITNSSDPTLLVEYGQVADLPTTSLPKNILVTGFQVDDNFIRSTTNYYFRVVFPAGTMNNARYKVNIDFPDIWDMIINYNVPKCALKDPTNNTVYASTCTNFGNRVTIQLDSSDLLATPYYYITLLSLRNPDLASCDPDRWIFSISDPVFSTTIARSHSQYFNSPYIPYKSNPKQINLKWVDPITNLEIQQVDAYIGVFQNKIALSTDYGIFATSFNLYLLNQNYITRPDTVIASFGYKYASFSISASKTATQGLQLAQFYKTSDMGYHSDLPFLKINVLKIQFAFNADINDSGLSISLPLNGQSLPILFDTSAYPPSIDVKLDSLLFKNDGVTAEKSVDFVNKSSLLLNWRNPKGFLVIEPKSNAIAIGSTGKVTFKLSSISSMFFHDLVNQTFAIVAPNMVKPALTLETIPNSDKTATTVKVYAQCSQQSTIYYLASTLGSRTQTIQAIIDSAWSFATPNYSHPYNYHFGFLNAWILNHNYQILISQLRPATEYNLTAFCMNANRVTSDQVAIQFITKSNGGKFLSIQFYFQTGVRDDLMIRVACFMAKYLLIPADLIKTYTNKWCDYQRRILSNTTGEVVEVNPQISTLNPKLYIYPLYEAEKDDLTSNLLLTGFSSLDVATYLSGNITGVPQIGSINQPEIGEFLPPEFVNASSITTNLTNSTITLKNLALDQSGFMYALIDQSANPPPTFMDIKTNYKEVFQQTEAYIKKFKLNQTIDITYQAKFTQLVDYSKSVDLEFTGLVNGTAYTVYFYATSDDPSIFAPRTEIKTISAITLQNKVKSFAQVTRITVICIMILITIL